MPVLPRFGDLKSWLSQASFQQLFDKDVRQVMLSWSWRKAGSPTTSQAAMEATGSANVFSLPVSRLAGCGTRCQLQVQAQSMLQTLDSSCCSCGLSVHLRVWARAQAQLHCSAGGRQLRPLGRVPGCSCGTVSIAATCLCVRQLSL